jgi:AcrR family transcriptional regulator
MNERHASVRAAPKERLLERAIEYLAAHGLSDHSLRQLATALGTSHRMLIYHFGSKEGLLVEVVRAVEARQRQSLARLMAEPAGNPIDGARRFWRQLSDPSLAPHERLFFEVYGQALQGRPHAVPLLEGVIDAWLEPVAALLMAAGLSEQAARAQARLGIAVTRGLLLDLLATGDVAGVNAAHEHYLSGFLAPHAASAAVVRRRAWAASRERIARTGPRTGVARKP